MTNLKTVSMTINHELYNEFKKESGERQASKLLSSLIENWLEERRAFRISEENRLKKRLMDAYRRTSENKELEEEEELWGRLSNAE